MTSPEKKILGKCTGPGGLNCPCCAPAPGSKARRRIIKLAQRRAKLLDMKEQLDD